MIKKILIFIVITFSFIWISNAIHVDWKTKTLYNNFVSKIDAKYDLEWKIKTLESLKVSLNKVKISSKYRKNKIVQNILKQFIYLNDIKISIFKWQKVFAENKKTENKKTENKKTENKKTENKKIENKNTENKNTENKNTEKTELEKYFDDNKNNIYNIEFEKDFRLKKSILWKYNLSKTFKNISYSKDYIFLENWIWKVYEFEQFASFPDKKYPTQKDLDFNKIDPKTYLLFVNKNGKLWFAKNFKKINLVSNYIIDDIDNKVSFLDSILNDKRKLNYIDYDKEFLNLKRKTKKITDNLNNNSKILNIYNYILTNVVYSKNLDFNDYKIFSGIETFKNNDWVCEGYARLMVYMSLFAGINNVEYISWYVIDAKDFPKIWHAWIKIWNKYYDPTFDDPIWDSETRKLKEYKYFYMPKDLFYTNRFDFWNTPEYIKKLDLNSRKKIVSHNLYSLIGKYKNIDYKILKFVKLKKDNGISYDEIITTKNLWKIAKMYIVNDFSFVKDWVQKDIVQLKYYTLWDNENLDRLLEQINYNFDDYYYFKWYDENWKISYRMGYKLKFK